MYNFQEIILVYIDEQETVLFRISTKQDDKYERRQKRQGSPRVYIDAYGVTYSVDGMKVLRCPSDLESYTIREGRQIIGKSAFSGCWDLHSITIPDSIGLSY